MSQDAHDGIDPSFLRSLTKQFFHGMLPGRKSSHIAEAMAAGLGYSTHASYLADLKLPGGFSMAAYGVATIPMARRLSELGGTSLETELEDVVAAVEAMLKTMPNAIPVGGRSGVGRLLELDAPGTPLQTLLKGVLEERIEEVRILPLDNGFRVQRTIRGEVVDVQTFLGLDAKLLDAEMKQVTRIYPRNSSTLYYSDVLVEANGIRHEVGVESKMEEGERRVFLRFHYPLHIPEVTDLGITHFDEWIATAKANRSGLLVVCGPNASGRTTTIFETAKILKKDGRKTWLLRNDERSEQLPAGEPIRGRQMREMLHHKRVKADSLLLIDVIRDQNDASLAIEASKAGMLVVAGLQGSSPLHGVVNLASLSISDEDLLSNARAVLSQELLSTYCDACAGHGRNDSGFHCMQCIGTGINGKTAISQFLTFGKSSDVDAALKTARNGGSPTWLPMLEDALDKVAAGKVPWSEVDRRFDGGTAQRRAKERGLITG